LCRLAAAVDGAFFDRYFEADISDSDAPLAWPLSSFIYAAFNMTTKRDCAGGMREMARFMYWSITSTVAREISSDAGFSPLGASLLPRVVARLQQGFTCGVPFVLPRVPADDNVTADWRRECTRRV
jgi:hypothetical protein